MSQEPTTTYCPACGKVFRVPPELVGKKIQCKACQTFFMVQADKPGIPAAAPAGSPSTPPTAAAAPPVAAAAPASPPPAPPTPPKPKPAPAAAQPPVTAATTAPAAGPPVVDKLALIPFDDSAPPPSTDGSAQVSQTISTRGAILEKVKIQSKGHYFVVKLVTAGKMVHVNIENVLNEHATDGWRLDQIISIGTEAYAILSRLEQEEKKAQ